MSHADIVSRIIASPCMHQVNRNMKMQATVNVMINNSLKKASEKALYLEQAKNGVTGEIQYGYGLGHGRGTGD